MPNVTFQKANPFSGLSLTPLDTQSILDIFVLQDIIDPSDAEKLKMSFKTNREIENFLLKNRLVSRDTINKAYSIILKLPFIGLKNVKIPEEALKAVPKQLASKFGIIPFDLKDNLLRLAISRPADLLASYPVGLVKVFDAKGLGLELFITGESDFKEVFLQYSKNANDKLLMNKGSLPVIQLKNYKITPEYLSKIPVEFIEKYRIVIFNQNAAGDYLVACQDPNSSVTRKVLDYLKKANNISLEVFATSSDDISAVVKTIRGTSQNTAGQNTDNGSKDQKKPPGSFSISNFLSPKNTEEGDRLTIDSIVEGFNEEGKKGDLNRDKTSINSEKIETTDSGRKQDSKDSDSDTEKLKKNAASTEDGMRGKPEISKTEEKEDTKVVFGRDVVEGKDLGLLLSKDIKTEADLDEVVKEGYVPKIVAAVMNFALNKKASDVHIEPQAKILRIRFRIDGVLTDAIKLPITLHPPIISRIKIISKLKIDETRIPQDGRFEVSLMGREVDIRVSSLPTVHGEKIVLRILDKNQKVLSLEDLGMQGTAFDKTLLAIKRPWGIILSTGPTGSGKSTTLTAILNRLNAPGVNIITLEDPVEYETPGANQCQVKPDIGFTFASGLRSVLRQDPNIIMVGEIRDGETAGMATHAALTGHLVLSTLHTNDTAGTLPRLINMGIEPFLITSSMNLVIAQRLVRLICPDCKEEVKLPQKLIEEIKAEIDKIPAKNTKDRQLIPQELKFYYGRGCSKCSNGYRGRIGLFEVMTMSPDIENLAIAKRPATEIAVSAIKDGMITMKQDGILKALQGLTTIDEVFQATIEK